MAKKKAAEPVVIEASPESPDVLAVRSDGSAVGSFLGGLGTFLTRAGELEAHAQSEELASRGWVRPTNVVEDERLVLQVRLNAQAIRDTEETFDPITRLLHRFHNYMTDRRKRALAPREIIKKRGNDLHNAYTEAELRRAREEELRQQRESEERARLDRERELAALEDQAVKNEAASQDLSEREQMFVRLVSGGAQGTYAAKTAGFKNPDQAADRLLKSSKIIPAIESARQAVRLRQQAEARRAAPLDVEDIEVKPEIATKGTTTWSAEIYDPRAFVAAALDPKLRMELGIPSDAVVPDQVVLNKIARDVQEKINRWPGVRAKKMTGIR